MNTPDSTPSVTVDITDRFPAPRMISTNGITMSTHIEGNGPAVVLLHGFPELAYSWCKQIGPLARAGWRVIAPDLRGYGATGPQGSITDYDFCTLGADVLGLMDTLDIDRAVVIGHDFGGALAWSIARDNPRRIAGIASLNTPYTHHGACDLIETMRRHRGNDNYMVQFQVPGVAEALLEHDIRTLFRNLMTRPALSLAQFRAGDPRLHTLPMSLFTGEPSVMGEPLLDEQDLDVFTNAFTKTGFTGPLNWYRNQARNWQAHEAKEPATRCDTIGVPALMISTSDDIFLPPETTKGMERYVPDLERRLILDCGHWTQHEKPEEVTAILLDWLERRMKGNI
jgi:soluble epoxide hydrolase / lipid-phosphate phosphatase